MYNTVHSKLYGRKKKKKISHRQLGPLRGSSSPFQHFEPARLNPIKLAYSPSPPDNGLGQYVSNPGNRAYCYAELAVSSLAMSVIITSTHIAYLWRDGQAELAWVAGYIQRWFTRFEDGHPSKY